MMFGFSLPKLIFISRIDFGKNKFFLFSVRITFRETIKYKSLYLKINSTKIKLNTLDVTICGVCNNSSLFKILLRYLKRLLKKNEILKKKSYINYWSFN